MKEVITGGNQQPGVNSSEFWSGLGEDHAFDLRRYWQVILNRRWVIVSVLVIVMGIVGLQVYRTKPIYEATGTIAIEPAQQQVVVGVQGFTPAEQTMYEGQVIRMQLEILQSRQLAERVIDRLNLGQYEEFAQAVATSAEGKEAHKARLVDAFQQRLEVDYKPASEAFGQRVVRVNFRSTDPQLAAQALNTLFESFIEYNREANVKLVEFASDWLAKKLSELEGKVKKEKEELLRYQQSTELLQLGEGEEDPTLKRFSTLNEQLVEAEAARLDAEILLRIARERGVSALSGKVSDPALDALKGERSRLEAQLAQLRAVYQDQAPPLKQLQVQMADLDDRIKAVEQTLLEKLQRDYSVANKRVQTLTRAVDQARAEVLKQNRDALQFSVIKGAAEADEKIFHMLSERLREAELMRSLSPHSNIRIIDRAEVPSAPQSSPSTTLLLSALVGLVLGVGLAFILEFLDDSVKSVDDVETLLRLPSLSIIPLADGQADRSSLSRRWSRPERKPGRPVILATGDQGSPVFAEAYRTLRTSVLLSSSARPPRTIVITGHEAGSGKTTTAVNMAIALAQAGKRVLLVDADMRHPACATVFGLDNTTGLSTYLSSEDDPAAIYPDRGVVGLDLLTSGPVPPNPSELLHSHKFQDLIESMATRYDHIVVDTPPLGLVSDALIVAALADGVILVVRAEYTSRRGTLRSKEALHAVNARILGVVLNAVDRRRHQAGYYGRGYGYGYGYGNGYYYYQSQHPQESQRAQKQPSR